MTAPPPYATVLAQRDIAVAAHEGIVLSIDADAEFIYDGRARAVAHEALVRIAALAAEAVDTWHEIMARAIEAAKREATERERQRCATIDNIDLPRVVREARASALEEAARLADSFTCGGCGMDGKAGAAIRALAAKPGATP